MDVSDSAGVGPVAAERKLVAVLVCELDESVTYDAEPGLDPIDHGSDRYLGRIQTEVIRHGGTVVEVMGETVLAVFGVPRTREDDAERAVRTALAIRVALAGSDVNEAGQLRVGIASGEALIRSPRGPSASRRWEVAGEVVATAMAIMTAAPLGAVLVTVATLRATERAISYAPAQLLQLAGASEPVAVWEALAPRPRSGRAPSPVLGVGLVGREGELTVLLDRYQRVCQSGKPHLVMLVGAAGIGKSRLLAEFWPAGYRRATATGVAGRPGSAAPPRRDLRRAGGAGQGRGGNP